MSCLRWSVVLGLVAMTVGCDGEGVELSVEDSGLWDADGDGYAPAEMGGLDCLDSDPAVSPEGVELPYDGLDNDCDPTTRDDDLDGDGYPSAEDCNDALDDSQAYALCGWGAQIQLGDSATRVMGTRAGDAFGSAVALDGDLDGDGHPNLVIGAYSYDAGLTSVGAVYVFPDAPQEGPVGSDVGVWTGEASSDNLGWSVSAGADLDGDGLSDLAMGARNADGEDTSVGALYVVLGAGALVGGNVRDADIKLTGRTYGDTLGGSVTSALDLTGDGAQDLVIGAPEVDGLAGQEGAVYIMSGAVQSGVAEDLAAATVVSWLTDASFGQTLSTGDLNGDGFSDLVVGAAYSDVEATNGGQVFAFYGPLSGTVSAVDADSTVSGMSDYAIAGAALSSGGDADGDGYDDLLVGAPGSGDYGRAALYLGPLAATLNSRGADLHVYGDSANRSAGQAVELRGDYNGDGLADPVVSVVSGDRGSSDAATATALVLLSPHTFGLGGADTTDTQLIPEKAGSEYESYLAPGLAAGDTNGDGLSDLLLSAPGYTDETSSAGAAYLLFGYSY